MHTVCPHPFDITVTEIASQILTLYTRSRRMDTCSVTAKFFIAAQKTLTASLNDAPSLRGASFARTLLHAATHTVRLSEGFKLYDDSHDLCLVVFLTVISKHPELGYIRIHDVDCSMSVCETARLRHSIRTLRRCARESPVRPISHCRQDRCNKLIHRPTVGP